MTTLEDRLDAIKSRKLDLEPNCAELADRGVHRPDFRVGADHDPEYGGAIVSLSIGALWGQQLRFASLTPDEAHRLARLLTEMAVAVETEVALETVIQQPKQFVAQTAERIRTAVKD